jgi:hypothetical protein
VNIVSQPNKVTGWLHVRRFLQVISVQPAAVEQLSAEICDKLLAPVRPAIEGLGGSVKVAMHPCCARGFLLCIYAEYGAATCTC